MESVLSWDYYAWDLRVRALWLAWIRPLAGEFVGEALPLGVVLLAVAVPALLRPRLRPFAAVTLATFFFSFALGKVPADLVLLDGVCLAWLAMALGNRWIGART